MPLANTLADVLVIVSDGHLVQSGFGTEIADAEVHAAMLEAMAKYRQNTIHLYSIFKRLIELLIRI